VKKLIWLLLLCSPLAAQTTLTLASGGIANSCAAVTASTSTNPGLAGGCTSFALLTSGSTLPSSFTWQVITTGAPATVGVNLMGSLDNVNWTQIDTTSAAGSRSIGAFAYRFIGCVPATLTGGSSPTITCQISAGGLGPSSIAGPLTIGTAECTVFGTAGGMCAGEGTQPTNVSGAATIYPDSTAHEWMAGTNGAASVGVMQRTMPGAIRSTGLIAAVSTATLCAASAGACNVAGTYHIHAAFYQSGVACTTNTTGGITPTLTWTDGNATAHTAVGFPLDTNSSLTALSGTMLFNQTGNGIGTVFGSGDINIDTNGSIIQYAIGFGQCSVTGTATYAASLTVTRLQ